MHVGRDPLTGRVRQVSRTTGGGIRAARALRSRLATEVEDGKHGGTESTVGYLLDAWNAQREREGKSPTTLHEDRRKIDTAIRPALGGVKLAKLSTKDLDGFYGAQLAAGASVAMVQHYHAILRAALNVGVSWNWLLANPALRCRRLRGQRADLPVPTPEEVQRLIETASSSRNPELAGVVTVAALTGLREGELCALRFSHVDGTTLRVESSAWSRGKRSGIKDPKSHQRRTIPIDPLACAVIERRRRMFADACRAAGVDVPDGYVWSGDPLGQSHLSPRSLSQAFGRIAKKAEVKARFHSLRDFAGTELAAAGFDPRTIADMLGHADPAFTMRVYTVSRAQRQEAAAKALGDSLRPKPAPSRTPKPPPALPS